MPRGTNYIRRIFHLQKVLVEDVSWLPSQKAQCRRGARWRLRGGEAEGNPGITRQAMRKVVETCARSERRTKRAAAQPREEGMQPQGGLAGPRAGRGACCHHAKMSG